MTWNNIKSTVSSAMRLRIRGPSGQSTVTLDDTANVEVLRKTIATETSLTSFDIKYGYPPKPLSLEQYAPTQLLTELPVKLNGEQLIVSNNESVASKEQTQQSKHKSTGQAGSSKAPPQATTKPSSSSTPVKLTENSAPAPLSLSRKENQEMLDPPEIFLPEVGGTLVLRIMPDDNSCLFRAVASAVTGDMDTMHELRSIVAQTIQANPEKYTKGLLEKEPDAYCRWIQTDNAWGGQIETEIFSQHFEIEICVFDVQSLRVYMYNEGAPRRCFLVYSGIHYDTIALNILGTAPEEDVKQFEAPIKDEILPQAKELCRKLQDRHYYTDPSAFKLLCKDCGTTCVGEAGATQHAKDTGHYNFGEAS